jgi:hypothetical protein
MSRGVTVDNKAVDPSTFHRVPLGQREPIENIAKWPDGVFERVLGALQEVAAQPDRKELRLAIADGAALDVRKSGAVLAAFLGLFAVAEQRNSTTTDAGLAISRDPSLKLTEPERNVLSQRYSLIAGIKNLPLIARARRVLESSEKRYCTADFRSAVLPLTSSEATDADGPEAVVLVTDLVVYYHEGEDRKSFHVTLDVQNLVNLTQALSNAAKSLESIRRAMEQAGLKLVDSAGHH